MAEVTIKNRDGYGQVEPNFMSGARSGRVFASLPAASTITLLEQGMFAKYDYLNGVVNFNRSAAGSWAMVYNEEKLYDERYQMHKHYAMKKTDFYDGVMTPRLIGLEEGDIFTTNTIKNADTATGVTLKEGQWLMVGTDGYLVDDTEANKSTNPADPVDGFLVVKVATMPDMQDAVKIKVTKAMS